ncbi:MAG: acetate--CoA ligase family protein [Thermodesulfobacteriota bacterium]
MLTLSDIAVQNPEITEIDLNPVIVHEQGLSIVDSRIIIQFQPADLGSAG